MHLLGKLPHRSLLELASRYGGLIYLKLGSVGTIVVSTPDYAKEVLKTQGKTFASRPQTSTGECVGYSGLDMVFAPYGEYWKTLRKLATTEILSSKKLAMFKPLRQLEMSMLLRGLLEDSKQQVSVSMSTVLSNMSFNTISRILFNKSYSHGSEHDKERAYAFKNAVMEGFVLGSGFYIGDFFPYLRWMDTYFPKIKKVRKLMDKYLQEEVDEHKKKLQDNPTVVEDFMDIMLSLGKLNDTSVKALSLDMMAGGTETSSVAIEWGLAELLKNPRYMSKLREEIDSVVGPNRFLSENDIPKLKYLQAVVKETLRLHPPGPLVAHESMEACKIGDWVIPPKTRVLLNIYAIGRNANAWENPEAFIPERFLNSEVDVRGQHFELLPFGSGRRVCPGLELGLLMVQYVLGTLVHSFDWKLPKGCEAKDLDMEEAAGMTMPRACPLMLTPSSRLAQETWDACI